MRFIEYYVKHEKKNPNFPSHFFPKFYGSLYLPSTDPNIPKHYLILQNLTKGIQSPCVCDLKMGGNSKGTDPHAGIIKHVKQKVVKIVSTSGTFNFRMEGMRSWRPNNTYVKKNKMECKLISEHTFPSVLSEFLSDGTNIRVDVIEVFFKKTFRDYGMV